MKLSNILDKVLPVMRQTKNYARIVGVILFVIGLLGFAFRSDNSLPDLYLGGALLLGFWGIVSGLLDNSKRSTAKPPSTPEPEAASQNEPESTTEI
jgi:hypothetical protein